MNEYMARATSDLIRLETIVSELLKGGGIFRPPVPENLVAFFDPGRAVRVKEEPLGQGRGILRPTSQGWIIVVNPAIPFRARRFSIFHEGFHILRRCGRIAVEINSEYQEWLADQFAARILMPRQWTVEAHPKAPDLQSLCRTFNVSEAAMTKRLRELRLPPKPDHKKTSQRFEELSA